MLSVCNVVRRTGETIYTVRDENHRKVADVTSDGFFRRGPGFVGYVQDCSNSTIYSSRTYSEVPPLVVALLDVVAEYVTWAIAHEDQSKGDPS